MARTPGLDYRFHGKRNTLSPGTYPDTSLALARRKADAARQLLAEGFDPSQQRKAERQNWAKERVEKELEAQGLPAVGSFEAIAASGSRCGTTVGPRATATR